MLVTATSLYHDKTDCIAQDTVDTTPFSQAESSLRTDLICQSLGLDRNRLEIRKMEQTRLTRTERHSLLLIKIVLGAIISAIDHGKGPSSVLH